MSSEITMSDFEFREIVSLACCKVTRGLCQDKSILCSECRIAKDYLKWSKDKSQVMCGRCEDVYFRKRLATKKTPTAKIPVCDDCFIEIINSMRTRKT